MTRKTLLVYIGHHKCATTWLNDISCQVCQATGLHFANVHNPAMFQHDLPTFLHANQIDFLSYTSNDLRHIRAIEPYKGFHVIRDPRDIVVSAYFSHLYSHPTAEWPELKLHRQKLQNASEKEGLFLEMEFRRQEFQDLQEWNYTQPNILEIKMETLIQAPYQTLVEVFTFLDILQPDRHPLRTLIKQVLQHLCCKLHLNKHRITAWLYRPQPYLTLEQLLVILYHNRFSAKASGRKPGEEDVQNHYRKGVSGDWRNHFDEDHKRYFKAHYNDILLKLGYETDAEW